MILLSLYLSIVGFQVEEGGVLNNTAGPRHVKLQNVEFGLILPKGFVYAPEEDRYIKPGTDIKLSVRRFPIGIDSMMEEVMAPEGLRPKILKRFTLNGDQAIVGEARFENPEREGEVFLAIILWWGNSEGTIQITGGAPDTREEVHAAFLVALESVAPMAESPAAVPNLPAAPKRIGYTIDAGALIHAGMIGNNSLFNLTGKGLGQGDPGDAQFTVFQIPLEVSEANRENYTRRRTTSRGGSLSEIKPITIAGLQGFEAVGSRNGDLQFETMLFAQATVFRLSGSARADHEAWLERFRSMAASFKTQ